VAVVVAAVEPPVPVPTDDGVEFAAVDDPQPAAKRAAPRAPSTAVLYRVLSISIHQDAADGETFPALSSRSCTLVSSPQQSRGYWER
jgi:hypothetical protein